MYDAYLLAKDNSRICKNLITLRFNIMDAINERMHKVAELYRILDKICNQRSVLFHQASDELATARLDIIKQFIGSPKVNLLLGRDLGTLDFDLYDCEQP